MAESDVILPNAHTANKISPIIDLWDKGWDLGEKPACEELNYVLNMMTWWMKYISDEQIPGMSNDYLRKDQNLNDVSDKTVARDNLEVYSKTDSDNRYVNVAGDVMTGALTVPRITFPSDISDTAYITTTVGADLTYLDFVIGDNPGTAGSATVDSMRFRFSPTDASSIFTMMELNATGTNAALLRVQGNITATGTMTTGALASTTINNGGNIKTNSLGVNATATVQNLVVNSNNATVGNRQIVRSVNNAAANANGDVFISIGVSDIRWSGEQSKVQVNFENYGTSGRFARGPDGSVLIGLIDANASGDLYLHDIDEIRFRFLQKALDGVWYTVGL
ncbi:putative tail fiber protein [Raoultella phage Ro1]|uniref:Putative tail fiber protein n=1 Tax=Raoultella phage Ro1 TaxID=2053702 RepID=A0A2H4YGY0_9CAUD|nr:tail fiber protein [Raoultella phage Ro1]AUE23428.1 putative tail fiber protein [Raoultella phage Ro1]